jgi:hypothetical protein
MDSATFQDSINRQALLAAMQQGASDPQEPEQPPQLKPSAGSPLDTVARNIWLAGAGADIGSTLYNAYSVPEGNIAGGEQNPLINKIPGGLPVQLAAGAGMELAARYLLKKLLAKNHPKLFDLLQLGAGAAHAGFATSNLLSR